MVSLMYLNQNKNKSSVIIKYIYTTGNWDNLVDKRWLTGDNTHTSTWEGVGAFLPARNVTSSSIWITPSYLNVQYAYHIYIYILRIKFQGVYSYILTNHDN